MQRRKCNEVSATMSMQSVYSILAGYRVVTIQTSAVSLRQTKRVHATFWTYQRLYICKQWFTCQCPFNFECAIHEQM